MSVKSAYSHGRAFCDYCGEEIVEVVYNCQKNRKHPNGYDLCVNCYWNVERITSQVVEEQWEDESEEEYDFHQKEDINLGEKDKTLDASKLFVKLPEIFKKNPMIEQLVSRVTETELLDTLKIFFEVLKFDLKRRVLPKFQKEKEQDQKNQKQVLTVDDITIQDCEQQIKGEWSKLGKKSKFSETTNLPDLKEELSNRTNDDSPETMYLRWLCFMGIRNALTIMLSELKISMELRELLSNNNSLANKLTFEPIIYNPELAKKSSTKTNKIETSSKIPSSQKDETEDKNFERTSSC
eukprot:TRINITY_DN809_c0_g1_i9.p2 TRINITY_DN809_c0_g1~~TRINITY_DN809_c0_g1_i9.p2  ORF type:complete len:295 (-),score=90.25 TRINITY_DN809_c0_g1_i9:1212-2096(-)